MSRSTGYSPFKVVYGFAPSLPSFPQQVAPNLDFENVQAADIISYTQ